MENIVKSFGSAYRSFFLRDILTIMLPGLITIIVVFFIDYGSWGFWGNYIESSFEINLGLNFETILLALISFPVGWSQFYMGIRLHCIRQFIEDDFDQYFNNELLYFKKINGLANQGIVDKEQELLYRERLSTTNQLIGSFFFTLLVCIVIVLSKIAIVYFSLSYYFFYLIYILYICFIGYGFWYAQDQIIKRQNRWQDSRINFKNHD